MHTMFVGRGSGGRRRTRPTGMPAPLRAAASSRGRYSPKRAMTPLITSCAPVCGMSRTASDTSTTLSPCRTPSRKSSKNTSRISTSWGCGEYTVARRLEDRQRVRGRAGAADDLERRDDEHEVVAPLLAARRRQRLQERVVEQRHAVGEEGGVHRPRNVIADRQMVEHVPDEDAHVVI